MTRGFASALAPALPLFLASAPCFAAEKEDPAAAETLFRAGRVAADAGDPDTACRRFNESYRLDPAIGTLLNVAECEMATGHLAEAWEHYRRVLDAVDEADERAVLARQRLALLSPKVPKLVLTLRSGAPASTVVERDGVQLAPPSFGLPLPLDPGTHEIRVAAPQRSALTFSVDVREGETLRLIVEPGPAIAPPRPARLASPEKDGSNGLRHSIGIAAIGAGGTLTVATAIVGWRYFSARGLVEQHCPTRQSCDDDGLRAAGTAAALQVAAVTAGTAALTCLGVGLVLVWTEPKEPSGGPPRPAGLAWTTAF